MTQQFGLAHFGRMFKAAAHELIATIRYILCQDFPSMIATAMGNIVKMRDEGRCKLFAHVVDDRH